MKKRRGSKQIVGGKLYGLFYIDGKKRESVPMPGVDKGDPEAIEARLNIIAEAIEGFAEMGHVDAARGFAEQLGVATSEKQVSAIRKAVAAKRKEPTIGAGISFRKLGEQWTSGELAKNYPDHIRVKRSAKLDAYTLNAYVYKVVGSVPVGKFGLDEADLVMRRLPDDIGDAARRHVAQAMHRMLTMAVYPLRLIAANPLPRGFLPKIGPAKAKQYLYPDEDAKLLACVDVPLISRLFYGVLDREGFRSASELQQMDWSDFDLVHGAIHLDRNKTDDPRSWAADPSVIRTMARWRQMRPELAKPFAEIPSERHHAARFRVHVKLAGIDRAGLLEGTAERKRLRLHDLRATFVTVALANDKTERWVMDRTGHTSSDMVSRYQRTARTHKELRLGVLKPLDVALVWSESPTCQATVNPKAKKAGTRRTQSATKDGGERGIRTLGTLAGTHDFQSSNGVADDAIRAVDSELRDVVLRRAGLLDGALTAPDERPSPISKALQSDVVRYTSERARRCANERLSLPRGWVQSAVEALDARPWSSVDGGRTIQRSPPPRPPTGR